jgi:hypothetical protein
LDDLRRYVKREDVRAVIFDNFWLPRGTNGFSLKQIDFAKTLYHFGTETFFLCRIDDDANNLGCELWRAHKPIQYTDMVRPALHIARIGVFKYSEIFNIQTGDVLRRGGGDSGWEQVNQAVRERRAFYERDWPKIVETVKRELSE